MAEERATPPASRPSRRQEERPHPPPLPPRLADPVPAIAVGTALWVALFLALLVARLGFGAGQAVWLWTALAGSLLGGVGYGVVRWQRAAARRGSRGAQRIL